MRPNVINTMSRTLGSRELRVVIHPTDLGRCDLLQLTRFLKEL